MLGESELPAPEFELVSSVLMEALRRKLVDSGRTAEFDQQTELIEVGLIDSQDLLDLIMEVEQRCGRVFDPERIDLEDAITLAKLASAFAA